MEIQEGTPGTGGDAGSSLPAGGLSQAPDTATVRVVPRLLAGLWRTEAAPRPRRDALVDGMWFLVAWGLGVLLFFVIYPGSPEASNRPLWTADLVCGSLSCLALWGRRRRPVTLALALLPVSLFSAMASGAIAVAVATVAVYRPFRTTALVCGLHTLTLVPFLMLHPEKSRPLWLSLLAYTLFLWGVASWGMLVRARRQLVQFWHERALAAETEQKLRVNEARRAERTRIAREMHDVLAHRLSLLSMQAGAMQYRPDLPPAELARTAGIVRDAAHRSLLDLREVIGVLREDPLDGEDSADSVGSADSAGDEIVPLASTAGLAGLDKLVAESVQAGARIRLDNQLADPDAVPADLGRTVYRVVQEGLTNARKHAPGASVRVTVQGTPGRELHAAVVNRSPVGSPVGPAIPGTGTGIIGLTERTRLVGGRLEHGRLDNGDYRLSVWLPWSA
ncbi:histidine kinase [Streptomyces pseudoechinosporeus]